MKVVVDANIIFSAILNSNGKIGDLLINSKEKINFIAPDYLQHEIFKHYAKLSKLSGLTPIQLRKSEILICKDIHFISLEQISESIWQNSLKLSSEVDENDTPYIALANQFRCKIWSGDKKLMN